MKKKKWYHAVSLLFLLTIAVTSSCGGGGGGDGDGGGAPVSAPNAPQNPSATSGVQRVTINWDLVTGANSYNIYYSNTPGVTKASGTKIAGITSPYQHTHLNVGTYYYVVTAVNSAGESSESAEASAPVNLLVFVTSASGDGNLNSWADAGGNTGLAAGDAICQARASAAGLTGTFAAWLSDSNNDAYCHVHNLTGKKSANCGQASLPVAAGPWIRTDGFPFTEAIDQILNNRKIYSPPRFDESGNAVSRSYYFTGTDYNGAVYLFQNNPATCTDWTNNAAIYNIVGGNTDTTEQLWGFNCNQISHLLCLQTGSGPSLPNFASVGKKAFLTSVQGNGNLGGWPDAGSQTGLAAGDAICQARASAAGLTGNFKAWLSDDNTNAIDRITSNGPWIRLDGVKIADNKVDLTDGSLFTSIVLTETGIYDSWAAWTGTDFDGNKSTNNNCNNWMDGTAAFTGLAGRTSDAGSEWSNAWGGVQCSMTTYRLYCLED